MDACQELAGKPSRGKTYNIVEKNVLGYRSGEHIIFYRIISNEEIEVARILHGVTDLKSKI